MVKYCEGVKMLFFLCKKRIREKVSFAQEIIARIKRSIHNVQTFSWRQGDGSLTIRRTE
jgi:hypothetical protein